MATKKTTTASVAKTDKNFTAFIAAKKTPAPVKTKRSQTAVLRIDKGPFVIMALKTFPKGSVCPEGMTWDVYDRSNMIKILTWDRLVNKTTGEAYTNALWIMRRFAELRAQGWTVDFGDWSHKPKA